MILSTAGTISAQGTTDAVAACSVALWLAEPSTGFGSATISLQGSFSGTVQFEGADDAGNWVAVNALPISGTQTAVTSATTVNIWRVNVSALAKVRARCSTFSSGPINVYIQASTASV